MSCVGKTGDALKKCQEKNKLPAKSIKPKKRKTSIELRRELDSVNQNKFEASINKQIKKPKRSFIKKTTDGFKGLKNIFKKRTPRQKAVRKLIKKTKRSN